MQDLENKAEETPAVEAPKKPAKEAKQSEQKSEDLTASTWKVINPFFIGDGEKRVKFEAGETLPKDISNEKLEQLVSLAIIEKA